MDLTEHYFAERKSFDLVKQSKLRGGSLQDASGKRLVPSTFRSSLIDRVEAAWVKPYGQLTCHEVCCMVGQKMILDWFAKPVLEFVKRYPAADCGYFPGNMLKNFSEAPTRLRRLFQSSSRNGQIPISKP